MIIDISLKFYSALSTPYGLDIKVTDSVSYVEVLPQILDLVSASKYSYFYTPDIRSMWGYIVFAFPFVLLFVRTYVRSFVFPSQGQSFCVKVYKTSYFEDPLMDFIHIWHEDI